MLRFQKHLQGLLLYARIYMLMEMLRFLRQLHRVIMQLIFVPAGWYMKLYQKITNREHELYLFTIVL